jgi:hypothetical protein
MIYSDEINQIKSHVILINISWDECQTPYSAIHILQLYRWGDTASIIYQERTIYEVEHNLLFLQFRTFTWNTDEWKYMYI